MIRLSFVMLVLLVCLLGVMGCRKEEGASGSASTKKEKESVKENTDKAAKPEPKKEPIPGGYGSPDKALDAYVESLRKQDVELFKKLFTYHKKRREGFEILSQADAKDRGPKGLDAAWKENLKGTYENEWIDGKYKKFPAEVEGDKATILCAYDSGPPLNEIRYRRYDFEKVDGLWYQTEWHTVNAAEVDTKKYKWDRK